MLNSNLTKKQVKKKNTQELERLLENSPYRNRVEAIGNNQTIQYVFEILHERGMIDCQTSFCFEKCERNWNY